MQRPSFENLHPCFTWMRDYLQKQAPAGLMAGRQHVAPPDLKPVLPLLNLVDVVPGPRGPRFRFRLVGTTQSVVAGREITGRFVEDAVLPEFVDRILSNMRAVVAGAAPIYDRFPMPHPQREFIETERIYFPLASDGRVVDMILIMNGYPNDPELMPRMQPVPSARETAPREDV